MRKYATFLRIIRIRVVLLARQYGKFLKLRREILVALVYEHGAGKIYMIVGNKRNTDAFIFDSNVLVYMFDRQVPGKQFTAAKLVQQEVDADRALLSTQVLQEFYNVVTVKLKRPLPKDQTEQAVQEFSKLPVRQVDAAIIMAAIY